MFFLSNLKIKSLLCWSLQNKRLITLKHVIPPSGALSSFSSELLCISCITSVILHPCMPLLHSHLVMVVHVLSSCSFKSLVISSVLPAARSPPGLAKTPLSALGLKPHQQGGSGQSEHRCTTLFKQFVGLELRHCVSGENIWYKCRNLTDFNLILSRFCQA